MFADAVQPEERAGAAAFVVRDLHHHAQFLRAAGLRDRADQMQKAAEDKAQSLRLDWAFDDRAAEQSAKPP